MIAVPCVWQTMPADHTSVSVCLFDAPPPIEHSLHVPSLAHTIQLVAGPYVFQKFEAWEHPGLFPTAPEALKLLHRLAADPGIAGIMSKHRWGVGLLSEMPPEGKVGVSPVCILGVNINAGQEISLRLRTDDLKGFRRFAPLPCWSTCLFSAFLLSMCFVPLLICTT